MQITPWAKCLLLIMGPTGGLPKGAAKGVLLHGACAVRHFFDVSEGLSKPLWQVFLQACGWFLEAPGWFLLLLGGFQVVAVTTW